MKAGVEALPDDCVSAPNFNPYRPNRDPSPRLISIAVSGTSSGTGGVNLGSRSGVNRRADSQYDLRKAFALARACSRGSANVSRTYPSECARPAIRSARSLGRKVNDAQYLTVVGENPVAQSVRNTVMAPTGPARCSSRPGDSDFRLLAGYVAPKTPSRTYVHRQGVRRAKSWPLRRLSHDLKSRSVLLLKFVATTVERTFRALELLIELQN
jgi:hypothetical protein